MEKVIVKDNYRWGEEVFSLLSWFDIDRVSDAKIMVVGAGALGNEVLKNLALFGVGHIVIVDYDTIEFSNLSRSVLFRPDDANARRTKSEVAAQRIREINPNVKVLSICGNVGMDVGLGIFRQMDVVIGCLDSRYARYLINLQCFRSGKTWIDGGIENLEGYVRVFSPDVNCYECSLTEEEIGFLTLKTGCPDIAKVNMAQGRIATTPISSSIIGAIQVQEALKIIHQSPATGSDDKTEHGNIPQFKTLSGKLLKYDGMFLSCKVFKMESYNDDCLSHATWDPVIQIKELSAGMSIEAALQLIKDKLSASNVLIHLRNNVFVTRITHSITEETYDVMLPESKISDFLISNTLGLDTRDRIYQEFIEQIGDDFPYKQLTLSQVGIPFLDVIEVSTSKGISYIELAGDKEFASFH